MANSEGAIIELNANEVTLQIENMEELIAAVSECASEIGREISKAVLPLVNSISQMQGSMKVLSESLAATATVIQKWIDEMAQGQSMDLLKEGLSIAADVVLTIVGNDALREGSKNALSSALKFFTEGTDLNKLSLAVGSVGKGISAAFTAIGAAVNGAIAAISTALGVSTAVATGIFAAIVVAIIAVITAIIVHWEDIMWYFTEELPRQWGEFLAWLQETAQQTVDYLSPIIEALQPYVDDFIQNLTQMVERYQEVFRVIGELLIACWDGIVSVWGALSQWFQDNIVQPVKDAVAAVGAWFSQLFESLWTTVKDVMDNIVSFIASSLQIVYAVWATVTAALDRYIISPVRDFFSGLWEQISQGAQDMWNGICEGASWLWDQIQGIFTPVWSWLEENIIHPALEGIRGFINGILGFINGILSGAVSGINGLIRMINRISFTVPDWVPDLGGQTFGFHLKPVSTPQIPLLAKGAVLPANKPFLAVVGDQRHGTNVEAPLATIQEAVAVVMGDQLSAMMAGFQALLEENRAIRRTIEAIEIGDNVIGEAALRYNHKMALITGSGAF